LKSVCKLLWKMLGYTDKKLRWSAAHAIQNLVNLGYSDIMKYFIELYSVSIDECYQDKGNYFFIESARVWFLLVCLRIFHEDPQQGIPFYEFFKDISCSNRIVHALQRRIAKHICITIAGNYYPNDIDQLLTCDELKLGVTKKSNRYTRSSETLKKDLCFNFDYTDTLRYWYDDVANIFNCNQEKVAMDCDYYVKQFSIDNNLVQKWTKKYLGNNYEYNKTLNDHGELPEIETLKKYAEWHSMFYVADKYRSILTATIDPYKTYADWLDSFIPGYNWLWSCEYRDHIPYIPFLWEFEKYKNTNDDLEYMIPSDLIQRLIIGKDNYNLNLNYNSSFDQSNQRVTIKSALIDEDKISALIIELEKPNHMFEDYYSECKLELRRYHKVRADIIIWPTCVELNSFSEYRLDRDDCFTKQMNSNLYSFSDNILEYCGYDKKKASRISLSNQKDLVPIHISYWSEPSQEGGYTKCGTYGDMAEIKNKLCLEFLVACQKAIVFECTIVFEDESSHFQGTPSKKAKERGIFVLFPNGKFEYHILDIDPKSYY